MDKIFKFLGNDSRLLVTKTIYDYGEIMVNDIVHVSGVPQSTVSSVLSKGNALGLFGRRIDGVKRYYSISNHFLNGVMDVVNRYE